MQTTEIPEFHKILIIDQEKDHKMIVITDSPDFIYDHKDDD